MDKEEWLKRCEAQFEKRTGNKYFKEAARACYNEMLEDFEDDPEGAADEEMSCWDDDGENNG